MHVDFGKYLRVGVGALRCELDAAALHGVAAAHAVDMPIAAEVYAVLYGQRSLQDAVVNLMQRGVRAEREAGAGVSR